MKRNKIATAGYMTTAIIMFIVITIIASWFIATMWLTLGAAGAFLVLSVALCGGKRIMNNGQ